jgi:hypothetical protein
MGCDIAIHPPCPLGQGFFESGLIGSGKSLAAINQVNRYPCVLKGRGVTSLTMAPFATASLHCQWPALLFKGDADAID